MAKQTKQQKIDRLMTLIQTLEPNEKSQDFSKQYKTQKTLSSLWSSLLCSSSIKQHDLRYVFDQTLPTSTEKDDDDNWGACEEDSIIRGRDMVRLLNMLLAELGPDPEKALVVWGSCGDFYRVDLQDTPEKDLDQYIKTTEDQINQNEQEQEQEEQWRQHQAMMVKVVAQTDRLGLDKALTILQATKADK